MTPEAEPLPQTGAIPVSPALGAPPPRPLDGRTVVVAAIAVGIALAATLCARLLVLAIALVTNLAFFGRLSLAPADPARNHLGPFVVVVPALGGIVVGLMARYGSRAIRGHGIPEAMEQVLTNESRVAPRLTVLKPVSSAVAIGTGGPFGAEGPIIATGGALGSLVGQLLHTTAVERKTLLAAGAAAGMTAIFGSPVAAVLLAVELLLFELRPRTLVPVALACVAAAGFRLPLFEGGPVFPMPSVAPVGGGALAFYVALGLLVGLAATGVTRLVYAVEDAFERLPIHWAWWPALGGLVVGAVGYLAPRTLGVGYSNIAGIVDGRLGGEALLVLFLAKLLSWSVSLGSGTSGGTLAPLLTIGGGLGAVVGGLFAPRWGIDPRVAGLVGMAAMFGGASRAFLTAVAFALETTGQVATLPPLLGGCAAAYLVSSLLMRTTIMTEKIERRGVRVPSEYLADPLAGATVASVGRKVVATLRADQSVGGARTWLEGPDPDAQHGGFPVVDGAGRVVGLLARHTLLDRRTPSDAALGEVVDRPAVPIREGASLRDAADLMASEGVGRLPVLDASGSLVGILTRGDLLAPDADRLRHHGVRERTIQLRRAS